jgi:hypothetical protein
MLGISPSAWEEAQTVLGETQAAVVVACILQRGTTIRSAGGYLRGLTRKAEVGESSRRTIRDFFQKTESDLMPIALARVRRLDCRGEGLLVRVKLALGVTQAQEASRKCEPDHIGCPVAGIKSRGRTASANAVGRRDHANAGSLAHPHFDFRRD